MKFIPTATADNSSNSEALLIVLMMALFRGIDLQSTNFELPQVYMQYDSDQPLDGVEHYACKRFTGQITEHIQRYSGLLRCLEAKYRTFNISTTKFKCA